MIYKFFQKFSIRFITYRLHQIFYFKQVIIRDNFKFIIDKKLVPLYNLKGLIVRFQDHEKDERELIDKFLKPNNTLELGCSIGVLSLYIKKIIKNCNLISIDANKKAIEYCKIIFELNKINNFNFICHSIGGDGFKVDALNFLSSRNNNVNEINLENSKKLLNELIKKYKIKNLVIDIEGMEEFLFEILELNEINIIIIEFHPNLYISDTKDQIIAKIESKNFLNLYNVNENYYFKKK